MTFLLPEDEGEQVLGLCLGVIRLSVLIRCPASDGLLTFAKVSMKKTGEDHMILTPFPRGLIGLVALSIRSKLFLGSAELVCGGLV